MLFVTLVVIGRWKIKWRTINWGSGNKRWIEFLYIFRESPMTPFILLVHKGGDDDNGDDDNDDDENYFTFFFFNDAGIK